MISRASHSTDLEHTKSALSWWIRKDHSPSQEITESEKKKILAFLKRAPQKISLRLKFPFFEQKFY